MKEKLLRCLVCNEVIPLTPCDFSPEYRQRPEARIPAMASGKKKDFEKKHQGHSLEELEAEGPYLSEDSWTELRKGFFKASNDKGEKFVIMQWREKVGQPMKYKILGWGYISLEKELAVQEDAIRDQLKSEAAERGLNINGWKLEAFIDFLKEQASFSRFIKAHEEEMVFKDHPLAGRLKLDKESVIQFAGNVFTDKRERLFIRDFIESHNDFSDILALEVKRHFKPVVVKLPKN